MSLSAVRISRGVSFLILGERSLTNGGGQLPLCVTSSRLSQPMSHARFSVILTSKLPQPVGTRFEALDICHTCIQIYLYAWHDHMHLQFDSMSHFVQILCQNSGIIKEASLWSARVTFMLPFSDRK